jgi:hypothetical protein
MRRNLNHSLKNNKFHLNNKGVLLYFIIHFYQFDDTKNIFILRDYSFISIAIEILFLFIVCLKMTSHLLMSFYLFVYQLTLQDCKIISPSFMMLLIPVIELNFVVLVFLVLSL